MHRDRHVGERLVPAGAFVLHGFGVAGDSIAAGVELDLALAPLQFVRQHFEEAPGVGDDGEVGRLVEADHVAVHVDLDGLLLGGMAPVGRLAPPVGFADARAEDQHHVGIVAHLVVELDVRHGDGQRRILGQHAARGPAGGYGRVQQLGDAAQRIVGIGMDDAAAGVDHRRAGSDQQLRGLRDLVGSRRRRYGVAVLVRRPIGDVGLEFAVHDGLGHVDMHHAGPPFPALAQRLPHQFRHAVEGGHGRAPLADLADDAALVEALVTAAAVGIHDAGPARAGDRQHAVAVGLLDHQAGQQVGDAGAVAGHADAELAGQPRIGAGHVRGAGFMARRDDLDAEPVQRGVEAEIGAVDDAEDLLDAFLLQHAGDDFAAGDLCHFLPPLLFDAAHPGGMIA